MGLLLLRRRGFVSGTSTIDISNAIVTAANQTYSGSALTPTATVTLNGTVVPSTGYDVVYSNNTNAGTATITVTGKGDYSGTAAGSFTIAKASRTISFAITYMVLNTSSTGTKTATPSAGSGDGAITYSINSTTYATINSSTGAVTSKTSDGSSTVTATIAEGTNYLSASATYTLYVFATTHNYSYSGSYSSVTLPPGTYQFQCWGAQGGSNAAYSTYGITAKAGGKGGYSTGQLTISQATAIRVYVGGQGSSSAAGYNGGGSTTGTSQYNSGGTLGYSKMGGGGGATDIRLSDGSLYSRMIVAGGGSGGAMCYKGVTTTSPVPGTPTSPSSSGTLTHAGVSSAVMWDISSLGGKCVTITYSSDKNAALYNGNTDTGIYVTAERTVDYDFRNVSSPKLYFDSTTNSTITYSIYNSVPSSVKVEKVESSYTQASVGAYLTVDYVNIYYRDNTNSSRSVIPDMRNKYIIGFPLSTSTTLIIDGYQYKWNGSKFVQQTASSTTTSTDYQVGGVGGGTQGGGYSSTYVGKQNAAGTGGSFGQGANQATTGYRYCSGAGGGGWYGGGGGQKSDSSMTYCKYSGGGSGFVNTAANASYRPSGYTGLQLDSGTTYAGNTSFPSTSGGTETGHSGNGYVKITRL